LCVSEPFPRNAGRSARLASLVGRCYDESETATARGATTAGPCLPEDLQFNRPLLPGQLRLFAMDSSALEILFEDNHLLALNKPAGLATMGAARGSPTLLALARQYIKRKYHKPGNVYLGIVSRLDAPASGVVLMARTSKAARRLSRAFRERRVQKTYWVIVEGRVHARSATLEDYLARDQRLQRMAVVDSSTPHARPARLSFRRLCVAAAESLLEVELETGRKHQIRVQLARQGHPVLGDRKYGARGAFARGIALHARRLAVEHPTTGESVLITAPLPAAWQSLAVVRDAELSRRE